MQLRVLAPALLHTPDQITDRALVALRVMLVPTGKLAEPVVPTGTFTLAGVETTLTPARPVAVTVSVAVVGAAPQTFATPAPPQVCGVVQAPQVSVPPQPSEIAPQFFPCAAQVVGVQVPQTFATPPPPQVCGAVQAPQVSVPPQPLEIVPQFFPCAAQVVGVQVPQTFATPPPPQVCGAVQAPQVSVPPQPLEIVPQFFPCAAQVVGVQVPQTFATPPPPQVCGAVQAPQVSVPPQPLEIAPQFFPCAAQVVGVQAGGLVTTPCHRVRCCTPPTVQLTWKLTALPAGTVPAARKWTAVARTSDAAWAANGVTVAVPEMAPTLTVTPVQPAG